MSTYKIYLARFDIGYMAVMAKDAIDAVMMATAALSKVEGMNVELLSRDFEEVSAEALAYLPEFIGGMLPLGHIGMTVREFLQD